MFSVQTSLFQIFRTLGRRKYTIQLVDVKLISYIRPENNKPQNSQARGYGSVFLTAQIADPPFHIGVMIEKHIYKIILIQKA